MRTWPLTGRAEELSVIADAFCPDRPHVGVVITGSPGVGKTRLAREAMALAAQRGWTVRWVAAPSRLSPSRWAHACNGPIDSMGTRCSW